MFLHIDDVKYLGNYLLHLKFNNGVETEIDFFPELSGEIFEPLKDKDFFKKVYINPNTNTIEWPNGADFAPEYLLELGKEIRKSA